MAPRPERRSTTRRASVQTAAPDLWQRRRWWFIVGGVAGAMALLAALTFALSGPEATERTVDVGPAPVSAELAADMTLATLDGDFRLSENRGEVMLLYFSFPG